MLPAGLLAGATLVVAIVFVIGFGSRSNQPVASGSSSPGPSATASATASASPSASGIASPTATATASQVAGTPAKVVASVPNCDITVFSGRQHLPAIVSGGDMFIECALPREIIVRVNLTTNYVVQAYPASYDTNVLQGFAVAGGALWVQNDNGSGCSQSQSCTGFYHLLRVDLASGHVTRDLADTILIGVRPGYVLAGDIKSGHDLKLDPATGDSMGQVPSALAGASEVCGSLWNRGINYSDNTTSFVRLDPAGTVLASFTEPGTVEDLQQVGNECWAVEHTYAIGADGFGHDTSYHFIRITPSGIDFRSPILHEGTHAAIFDGTFWMVTPGTGDPTAPVTNLNPLTTMQRIDPATWQPAGPVWTYTGSAPAFAAGGSLWAAQAGNPSQAVDRLDVPLGAIGS
jgi:hypothetical protein